jgi:predicted DNA-binding transcriptional regulator YafY
VAPSLLDSRAAGPSVALGYGVGFGRGAYANNVATFIARRMGVRTLGDLLAAHGTALRTAPDGAPDLPEPLARALAFGGRVSIRYADRQRRVTEREVRPIEVIRNRLVAWRYRRNAERTFVLDRIEAIRLVEGPP